MKIILFPNFSLCTGKNKLNFSRVNYVAILKYDPSLNICEMVYSRFIFSFDLNCVIIYGYDT
jgi:hypothetical protein